MKILLRLLARLQPHWKGVTLAYICTGGVVATQTFQPVVIKWVIDIGIAKSHSLSLLTLLAIVYVAVSVARGLFALGQQYLGTWMAQKMAYDLRNDLYDRYQRLSFAFHDRSETGQLMSRATVDTEYCRQFMSMGLLNLARTFVQVTVTVILMLKFGDWRLAGIMLLTIPGIGGCAFVAGKKMRALWFKVQTATGVQTSVLQENITSQRIVKAFAREPVEQEKFERSNRDIRILSIEATRLAAFTQPFLAFLLNLATAFILWYGGREVIHSTMTLGSLAAFIQWRQQLNFPIKQIGFQLNNLTRAIGAGDRVFEILDTTSEIKDRPGAVPLVRPQGHVRFEDVSFGYDHQHPVLRHIDIDAQQGQTIALLGPPGSGKSTLINLLPRFYDVTSGQITIDDIDIRDLTLESLRNNIGLVLQDAFLFNATIRENIAYGSPNASEEEIISAAKMARIHDFIQSLPEGYDTWVGERGVTLSGGQRQRTAIARTLLRDPRILILDDSTSSVDMETEYLIQQALTAVMQGRTTFVIAQRLRTIRDADQILVLQDGEVVERGTHQELIANSGRYRRIYDVELREQEELLEASRGGGNNAASAAIG